MDYRLKTGHYKQKLSDGGNENDWAEDETTKIAYWDQMNLSLAICRTDENDVPKMLTQCLLEQNGMEAELVLAAKLYHVKTAHTPSAQLKW